MGTKRQQIDFSGGDEVAIGLAAFVLLQSLAWPFLMATVPSLVTSNQRMAHHIPGAFSALVSMIVLGVGYDFHRDRRPVIPGILGITLIIGNVLAPTDCCSAISAWVAGSLNFSEVSFIDWFLFFIAPCGTLLLLGSHISNRQILGKRSARKKA